MFATYFFGVLPLEHLQTISSDGFWVHGIHLSSFEIGFKISGKATSYIALVVILIALLQEYFFGLARWVSNIRALLFDLFLD